MKYIGCAWAIMAIMMSTVMAEKILHWNFDEVASGGWIKDQAGTAHARIYGGEGSELIQPGVFGNAISLGSVRRYLKVESELAPNLENDFTIYCVIKPSRVESYRTILWKGDRRVEPNQINYFVDIRDGKLELKTMDASGQWIVYATSDILQDDEWYEIYIHYKDGNVRMVVNGEERSVGGYESGKRQKSLLANEHPLYIGEGSRPGGIKGFPFYGLIDEIKIYQGNAIDTSVEARGLWQDNLAIYKDRMEIYELEQSVLRMERQERLKALYRDLFEERAGSTDAPFYTLALPAVKRIEKREDFVESLLDLSRDVHISAARNEYEGFQILVLGNPDYGTEFLSLDLSDLKGQNGNVIEASHIEWGWVRSITTEAPDIPVDFVGAIPDVIMEGEDFFSVEAEDFTPVFVRIYVAPETKAGTYTGTVTVFGQDYLEEVNVTLNVYDFTLPVKGSIPVAFSFFDHYYTEWYGLSELSDEQTMGIYDFLLKYRIPPNNIYTRKSIEPEPRFLEELKGRTNFFTLMGWGGNVLEGEALQDKMSKYDELINTIRDMGMLDDLYFYGSDELAHHMRRNLPAATQAVEMLSKAYPWLRMMQTSFPIPELRELYNVWVPLFSYFADSDNVRLLEELRENGAEIWWYAADDPQHPMPNFFLDYPVFDNRIIMTLSYMYNIEGILYWCINREWATNMDIRNSWPDAEWRPFIYHMRHGTRKWRNGMGNYMYPAPDGRIYPSLRLENLRDGLEDYEYLKLLEALAHELEASQSGHPSLHEAKALLSVPANVATAIDHYNPDPEALLEYRDRVARQIEELKATNSRK